MATQYRIYEIRETPAAAFPDHDGLTERLGLLATRYTWRDALSVGHALHDEGHGVDVTLENPRDGFVLRIAVGLPHQPMIEF
jgi:hypothetical protein